MELILLIGGVIFWLWLLSGSNTSTGDTGGSRRSGNSSRRTRSDGGEDDEQRRDGIGSDIENVDTDLESIRQLQR